MIRSFRDTATTRVWTRQHVPRWSPQLQRAARRKLVQLNSAVTIEDLRVPPGNRLEALSGARAGQHSIRINDQWRLCFTWTEGGPENAEIVDYH
ncbi:MAG: type II toxin-antitoxin system RelE/ParE family toxin [Candidatus Nanopelagicales bacterium]|nr:type II toxin-antitoxin system RelE/ParE family toxin [Candidatus Nanopelagicales bacterium]MDZ4248993.1 type II toxin-antitoxin system RelE/ParE family toxin [Candidatus Nanopelagicales bacterium]